MEIVYHFLVLRASKLLFLSTFFFFVPIDAYQGAGELRDSSLNFFLPRWRKIVNHLHLLQISTYGRILSYMELKTHYWLTLPLRVFQTSFTICSYIFFGTFPFVLNIARHKAAFQMKQGMQMHAYIFLAVCFCFSVNNKAKLNLGRKSRCC